MFGAVLRERVPEAVRTLLDSATAFRNHILSEPAETLSFTPITVTGKLINHTAKNLTGDRHML